MCRDRMVSQTHARSAGLASSLTPPLPCTPSSELISAGAASQSNRSLRGRTPRPRAAGTGFSHKRAAS
eukprot:802114-Alexandrium_andersonii.AAC.1